MHKVLGLVSLLLLFPSFGFSQVEGNITTFFANRKVDAKTSAAFFKAVKAGNYKLVNTYLTKNSNLANVSDKDGNTALMHAARAHNLPLMTLLAQKGAKINTTNNESDSALCRYLDEKKDWIAPKTNLDPMPAVQFFLNHNAHVNIHCGRLYYHWHADDYYAEFTPLHFAVLHLQPQMIKALIARGANVNAKAVFDGAGDYTPFDMLFEVASSHPETPKASKKVYEQVISLLLNAGAKIDETAKENAARSILYKSNFTVDDNLRAAFKSTGIVTDKDLVKYKIK